MAIRRTKRIELKEFEPLWNESYLIVQMQGYLEIQEFQKEVKVIQNELNKAETDKEIAEASDKLFTHLVNYLQSRFVSGLIYDFDLKANRAFEKEDFKELDLEVLMYLVESALGTLKKN
jgi:hypothetical protein